MFATIITNLGFPIGVSIYLLIRFEKKIDGLEKAIDGKEGLSVEIKNLKKVIEKHCECEEDKK